jgi:hypothetical protein
VEEVRAEAKAADPYPGGGRWEGRLRGIARRLEQTDEPRRYRWFDNALEGFAARDRDGAVQVLDSLHARLVLLEEAEEPRRPALSPDQIKSMLPRHTAPRRPSGEPPEKKEVQRREPPAERDDAARRRRAAQGAGPRPAAPGTGLGNAGWVLLGGLAVAILGVAAYMWVSNRREPLPQPTRPVAQTDTLEAPDLPGPGEKSPEELWRQACVLAGEGRHPEALRLLYLAVLFLLDRRRLLRYEPTRTNGEYVRQVRLADNSPEELHLPFETLTALFESRWYGGVPCAAGDFQNGEHLAGDVRDCVGAT